MNIRQIVSGVVVFSLVASTLPALAETPAGSTPDAVAPETVNTFRASMDRAVASVAEPATAAPSTASTPASKRASLRAPLLPKQFAESGAMANEEQAGVGGGGGGHLGLIIGLVTTVASLATTYFVIKQMKKTMSTVPTPTVP
jgi:hypothetical protein